MNVPPPGLPSPAPVWAPERTLRRLGNGTWTASVADLLGLDEGRVRDAVSKLLPAEQVGETGFPLSTATGPEDTTRLLEAARAVTKLLDGPAAVAQLAACPWPPEASREATCARATLEGLATRAFRRPPTSDERDDLATLWTDLRAATGTADEALREAIPALLVAPSFLYHDERMHPVGDDAVVALDGPELAGRLAEFLWRSVPDASLAQAALDGSLLNEKILAAQADRMLREPRAGRVLAGFTHAWLGTRALEAQVRNVPAQVFSAGIAAEMNRELATHVQRVVLANQGSLATLLGGDAGAGLPSLLTLPAVMAMHASADEASPIKRGKLVRDKLLCQPLPSPPGDVPPLPPQNASPLQGRARFEAHATDARCRTCHERMDPIGFAFSAYDQAGRFLADDHGRAWDTSGRVVDVDGQTRTFSDLPGLLAILASSHEVERCAVRQWARYALEHLEGDADEAGLEALERAFVQARGNVRQLLLALVGSTAFRMRAVMPGESTGGQP